MAAERLRFAPRFAVNRVDDVGVFLVSEDGAAVLSQPVHLALAPLLDGRRTADEAVDALDGSFSALEVYHAIETMTAKGYVVYAGAETAPDEALAYWGLAGIDEVAAGERLATMTVGPVALDGISHDALTQALGAAGLSLAHPPEADLTLVAVADYLTPGLAGIDARQRADVGRGCWCGRSARRSGWARSSSRTRPRAGTASHSAWRATAPWRPSWPADATRPSAEAAARRTPR